MDLQTMLTEFREIIGEPEITNSHWTSNTLPINWANEFYRRVAVKLGTLPITERSYTLTEEITLNSNTFSVDKAKVYIRPANAWRELIIRDIKDLYSIDPDWENAASGEPEYLIRMATFTARLYPAPNSANVNQASSLKTHGLEFPTALANDTDVPDLPPNLHDLFPYWMAHKAFMRLADRERSAEQLLLVTSALKDMQAKSTRFSKGRGWVWSSERYADPEGIFQDAL